MDHDLEIIPVINKIDLPSARPDEIAQEIEDVLGLEAHDAPRISAKTGENIKVCAGRRCGQSCLRRKATRTGRLPALVFDSLYDNYKGAMSYVRVMEGSGFRRGPDTVHGFQKGI